MRLIRFLIVLLLAAPAAFADDYWRPDASLGGVQIVDPILLTDPNDGRTVPVKAIYPGAPGPHPLVVFSHGAYSSKDEYDRLALVWAGRGYVVMLPTHIDSTTLQGVRGQMTPPNTFETRLRDIRLILAKLDEIADRNPDLKGKIDRERIAIAGHSFGGQIAQVMTGASIAAEPGGAPQALGDPRLKAAIVLMGAGHFPGMMDKPSWQGVGATPQLVVAGTADAAVMIPDADWRWRYEPYELLPPGDKYGVVLQGSDHYLGGLICRPDVPGPQDAEGLQAVNAAAIAFLDAYLKDDRAARAWLAETDLASLTGGKARLDRK